MITLTTPAPRRGAHVPPFYVARKSARRSSVPGMAPSAPSLPALPPFALKYSDLDGFADQSPECVPALDLMVSHSNALVDRQMARYDLDFRPKLEKLYCQFTKRGRYGFAQSALVMCSMLCIQAAHGQPILKTDPPAEKPMTEATRWAHLDRALPLLDRLMQYSIELKRFAAAWGRPDDWKRMGFYSARIERVLKSRPVKAPSKADQSDAETINGRRWALRMGLCLALLEAEQGTDAADAALCDIASIARLRPRTAEGRRAVQIGFELTGAALGLPGAPSCSAEVTQ